MTELEELIEQKRAIEDRIKELKNDGTIIHKGIKLAKDKKNKDTYDGTIGSTFNNAFGGWRIGIRTRNKHNTNSSGFARVVEGKTREETIEKLACLIEDLKEFYDMALKKEETHQE